MRILGIDPGTRITGYGFIDYQDQQTKLIEVGDIRPKSTDPLYLRIHRIYELLGELIDKYRPDVLVLEKIYAHHKYVTTASILGHVRGVICLLCAQKNIELVEHSVKRIRKALTGNGSSSKQQTAKVVCYMLKINGEKLTLDASDALALALGYTHIHHHKL